MSWSDSLISDAFCIFERYRKERARLLTNGIQSDFRVS